MRCGFKLLFRADDDARGFRSSISSAAKSRQNRHGHPAQHQDDSDASAEFVDVAKQIMNLKAVSLSSMQQVALECVCFRLLLAKASDSACGQNPKP